MEISLAKKIISILIATTLIISIFVIFSGINGTVKAATPTTLAITATATSTCTNSPIRITATLIGGVSPAGSTITWQTSSGTGTFSGTTPTGASSKTTYVDTTGGSVTITASYAGDTDNGASSNTMTITAYNLDFNHDGPVNFNDILYFVQAYISYQTSGTYNASCDFNNDHVINFNDILLFVGIYDSYTGPV
jgi:hypothetical protein